VLFISTYIFIYSAFDCVFSKFSVDSVAWMPVLYVQQLAVYLWTESHCKRRAVDIWCCLWVYLGHDQQGNCLTSLHTVHLYDYCIVDNLFTLKVVSNSQVIGCEDRLRNDLYCVGWGVKLYSIQFNYIRSSTSQPPPHQLPPWIHCVLCCVPLGSWTRVHHIHENENCPKTFAWSWRELERKIKRLQ